MPVSPDQLSALLNERLEVGLGPRSAPATPGSGFSSLPPHVGAIEQGTFSGGVESFVSDMSYAAMSSPGPGSRDTKPGGLAINMSKAFAPVCLLLADSVFLSDCCCGTIGKAGKFCTKRRDNSGDTTCGTRAHLKKATMEEGFIYFWDEPVNIGYLTPSVNSRVKLADVIWEMRGEELPRLQVKELMEAIINGDATSRAELEAIKERTVNPSSGVSFTPRKKPRYSDDWDFPELELLPTIEEGPDPQDAEELQGHIGRHWKDLVATVETLKSVAGRNTKYEEELDSLGSDIDSLRSALARVNNLVGNPVDGLSFDLFGIIDRNEEALLELDQRVHSNLESKITDIEERGVATQKEVAKFWG
jgi:hypothetical protein